MRRDKNGENNRRKEKGRNLKTEGNGGKRRMDVHGRRIFDGFILQKRVFIIGTFSSSSRIHR
jgi:hypothetical protein